MADNVLMPRLDGQRVSVAAIMSQPTWLRAKIAELTEGNELVSAFFTAQGEPVQGGGILHPRLKSADRYTADDVVERAPGDEYQVVRAIDPEYRLAAVRDYGAKTTITDEEIARGDMAALNNKVLQLTNTLTRKLNTSALAAIDDATPQAVLAFAAWDTLVTEGPESSLTPSTHRPLADMVRARQASEEDRLGIKLDTLLVSTTDAASLRVGYGPQLADVLAAAEVAMITNPYIETGRAYLVQKGKAGVVGYEAPLTVDVIDRRETRDKVLQVYAVPSYAVDKPQAVKVITGTVTP
ncbi:hypothetical protein TPB0596_46490 [Tsukamurella pulmonis]|uniref:major capsid protein n=1 Tax=Tsukamurella pulmonis TaxID=47312 RepID=UPI001EDEEAE7|nr:major capsid protein [Tsukamurella pulmonis]BDD84886.1 hypothetical protein TPB0596_46490 [Tsukamurella pulmonis]